MFDLSRITPHLPEHGHIYYQDISQGKTPANIFCTVADSVTKFRYLGIRKGSRLIFDLDAPFEEGKPSCFVDLSDESSPKLQMGKSAIKGCEYVGRLLYCINHYS